MTDEAFKEKLRSLQFRTAKAKPKKTVDVHDHHTVEVTTSDERQDVHIKASPVKVSLKRD